MHTHRDTNRHTQYIKYYILYSTLDIFTMLFLNTWPMGYYFTALFHTVLPSSLPK